MSLDQGWGESYFIGEPRTNGDGAEIKLRVSIPFRNVVESAFSFPYLIKLSDDR